MRNRDQAGQGPPSRPAAAIPPQGRPSAPGYPVVLSLGGWACLVVGGGSVAVRKARGLAEAGALVTVVAAEASPALLALVDAPTVVLEERAYRRGEAAQFGLVVTATGDPAVDASVVADAVAASVLVNSADGDVPGTIQLPAVIRRGTVTVAVGTGGASPAVAAWLSDRIAAGLPPHLATVAELAREARAAMRAAGRATDSLDWAGLLDSVVLPLVEADRVDDARRALHGAWRAADDEGRGTEGEPGAAPR